ncbi:kinase-like protein [Dacryopinax primogenitus]|uniref:Kinase-like protein n=1 Tax=Dacryopinax primogenitus (strain DJM 731) TaxID=1858805 RepID=M5G8M6_DACPD|nr:kinase-like protein [Dacryopinax primogenitus]EJU00123.1 kinase-like protein [Dacryopinax primogenitus]
MQSNSAFLLLHGDSLTLPNDQTFRVSYKVPLPLRPESLRGLLSGGQTGSAAIGNGRYLVNSTELGNGTFGSVHLAVDMIKGRQVACKIIPLKSKDDSSDIERSGKYAAVMREVDILKKLSHPNINEVLDVCETSARTKICVVLGLSTGGDLFSHLVRRTRLNEMEAKYFLLQIFYGIKYLHQKGVAHRDLKPENILLVTPPPFPRLQIADFGLARMFPRDTQAKMNNRSLTVLGTVDYIAPEIAELMQIGQEKLITPTRGDVIAMAGDSWAIGCIAYQMFTGFQPFYPYEYMDSRDHDEDYHEVIPPAQPFDVPPAPETIEDDRMMPLPPLSGAAVKSKDGTRDELVRKAIMECKPDMSHDIWDSVPNARTMIEKLLDKLPQCRWTAKRALECGWMKADRKAMDEMYEKTIDMKD